MNILKNIHLTLTNRGRIIMGHLRCLTSVPANIDKVLSQGKYSNNTVNIGEKNTYQDKISKLLVLPQDTKISSKIK